MLSYVRALEPNGRKANKDRNSMPTPPKTTDEIAAAAKANAGTYLGVIPPEVITTGQRLLERYAGLSPEQAEERIFKIVSLLSLVPAPASRLLPLQNPLSGAPANMLPQKREKAWAVFPYGCVGAFWFLNLDYEIHDAQFQQVVACLLRSSTDTFLDVGCCFGSTIRYLADRGVPSERLYGTDLQQGFLDLGGELFGDGEGEGASESKATFIAGDMVSDEELEDGKFEALQGKVDVVYASLFFHLFERGEQVKAAKRMVGFLRKDNPDVVVFGRNMGRKIPGSEKYMLDGEGVQWQCIWDEVGEATGTAWRTEWEVDGGDGDLVTVRFVVRRA